MAANGLLGTTRRGRPVYHVGHASYAGLENHRVFGAEPHVLGGLARQAHPHYSAADHAEAADFHYAKRNLQAGRAHDAAAQQMSKGLTMHKAGGEGSRGGKVIGHTKGTGKPIYAATKARHDGMRVHPKGEGHHVIEKNPGYTPQDHMDAADHHERQAKAIDAKPLNAGRHSDASFGKYARHVEVSRAHRSAAKILSEKSPTGSIKIKQTQGTPIIPNRKTEKLRHSLSASGMIKAEYCHTDMGTTSSGLPIPLPWSSPLGYVYDGVGQELDVGQAAAALGAAGPSMAAQDHLDTAVAYHALAAALSRGGDARSDASAKAAFMHFAAAGVDPMSVDFAPAVMGEAKKSLSIWQTKSAHAGSAGIQEKTMSKSIVGYLASGEPVYSSMPAEVVAKSDAASVLRDYLSKAGKGEGSRGGKIEGHTRSGRPIYAKQGPGKHSSRLRLPVGKTDSGKDIHGLAENSNASIANGILHAGKGVDKEGAGRMVHKFNRMFTHKDHMDAAIAHKTKAAQFRGQANRMYNASGADPDKVKNLRRYSEMHDALALGHHAASQMRGKGTGVAKKSESGDLSLSKAEKGEGSRGGKVIGHTKSGKPVYASSAAHSSKYAGFTNTDHADAASLHSAAHSSGVRLMIDKKTTPEDAKKQNKKNRQMGALTVAHARAASDANTAKKSMVAQSFAWAPPSSYMGKYRAD